MNLTFQFMLQNAVGLAHLTFSDDDIAPCLYTRNGWNVNPAVFCVQVKRHIFTALAHILYLESALVIRLFALRRCVRFHSADNALCVLLRQIHAVQIVVLTVAALALRHCNELPVFAVNHLQVKEGSAGHVQGEHANPIGNEVTGLNGCTFNGQVGFHGLRGGVLVGLVKHNTFLLLLLGGVGLNVRKQIFNACKGRFDFGHVVDKRFKEIGGCFQQRGRLVVDILHGIHLSENPTEQELLAHRIRIGRIKGGRGLVCKNRSNVMLLCFQLCRLLFHSLATMTTGVPLGRIRKTKPRALLKLRSTERVKTAQTVNNVQKVSVLIIDKAVNVLGRVLINQGMVYVGSACARSRTGARVLICHFVHLSFSCSVYNVSQFQM
nr:MAG TPA: hypothetical protein [Caudoviricetes sp.]